jgi:hypothetical protein
MKMRMRVHGMTRKKSVKARTVSRRGATMRTARKNLK